MNILYLVFGDTLRYHIEANLSIRTFQRQMTEKDRIIVFTNRPEYYRRAQVEVMTLTDEQMNEWRGKHQYLFRILTICTGSILTTTCCSWTATPSSMAGWTR